MTGRPCNVCRSSDRAAIESALLTGERISRVSSQFKISPDALRRHVVNHAATEFLEALEDSESVNPLTVARWVVEIAEDARSARQQLVAAGDHRNAIKARDGELRALAVLSGRLGIDSERIARDIAQADQLQRAIVTLTRQDPAFGIALADTFAAQGSAELARVMRDETQKLISRNKEIQS